MKNHTMAAVAVAICSASAPADAAIVVSIDQVDNKVVSTTTGTFDTALAVSGRIANFGQGLVPAVGFNITGVGERVTFYELTGLWSFGTGGGQPYDSTSGIPVGLNGTAQIFFIDTNYVSNSSVYSVGTINNATLLGLGLTTGVYEYSVGGNSLTLNIGVSVVPSVPEPATWAMMLVGFGMVGAASRYRRRAVNVSLA